LKLPPLIILFQLCTHARPAARLTRESEQTRVFMLLLLLLLVDRHNHSSV
jgi:hypothetical protein